MRVHQNQPTRVCTATVNTEDVDKGEAVRAVRALRTVREHQADQPKDAWGALVSTASELFEEGEIFADNVTSPVNSGEDSPDMIPFSPNASISSRSSSYSRRMRLC